MRIGIDIGGTTVRMGIVDGGIILKRIIEPCKADKSVEETVSHLKKMIHKIMNTNIRSIGIGVPALVDAKRGIIHKSFNIPSWKDVHLKEILEDEFHIPVNINNDCNCFAFGERYYGKGRTFRNLVCITLGTGLGAGIIIENKLYCGKNNGAGELGSLFYENHNYEHFCSNHFFKEEYNISGKEAHENAMRGNAEALRIWNEFGVHLGSLINAIMFTYDPEAIIIGGRISLAKNYFSEKMLEEINNFPFLEAKKRFKILFSENEDSSLLGAAALV